MYLYRITNNKQEILEYLKGNIYFNENENLFNKRKNNSLYEINTFIYDNKVYKHFYYFPLDAYEISKILLNFSPNYKKDMTDITILEYYVDNSIAHNKVGFGNYNCLKRKDYIDKKDLYHITPFEDSTYPVLEFRFCKNDEINITKRKWSFDKFTPFPNNLNDLKKLKQFIYYKINCESILNDLGVNYPRGTNGLMRISKSYNNVKDFEIPKKYMKVLY